MQQPMPRHLPASTTDLPTDSGQEVVTINVTKGQILPPGQTRTQFGKRGDKTVQLSENWGYKAKQGVVSVKT